MVRNKRNFFNNNKSNNYNTLIFYSDIHKFYLPGPGQHFPVVFFFNFFNYEGNFSPECN